MSQICTQPARHGVRRSSCSEVQLHSGWCARKPSPDCRAHTHHLCFDELALVHHRPSCKLHACGRRARQLTGAQQGRREQRSAEGFGLPARLPMVGLEDWQNSFLQKRVSRLVLPTPLSPTTTTCRRASGAPWDGGARHARQTQPPWYACAGSRQACTLSPFAARRSRHRGGHVPCCTGLSRAGNRWRLLAAWHSPTEPVQSHE